MRKSLVHTEPNRDLRLISALLLILANLLGIVVRWNFIAHSAFPINDGGLFYQMIEDLIANHFRLPVYTTYNQAGIPFAYPPLSFYMTGVLAEWTQVSLLDLLHYLPFGFSVLTIPAFYLFTRTFYAENLLLRSLATLIFATLPRSFEWFVMGGGLTRSIGFFFAVMALIFISRVLEKGKGWWPVAAASLFTGLTVLSHPVASLFLAFSIILLFIYHWPGPWLKIGMVGLGAVLISAPWWTRILSLHGLDPFVGATNTGHTDWFQIKLLLTLNFEYENRFFLPLVSFTALVGLFSPYKRKALFLGLLVGLGYLFIPRGGIDLLTIYLALLGTLGFDLIAGAVAAPNDLKPLGENQSWLYSPGPKALLFFLMIYTFLGAYTYKFVDEKVDLHLTGETFQALIWLKEQTPEDAAVIALPPDESHRNWPNDYWGEWLPSLSQRESLGTVQGYEWLPALFSERIYSYISLRSCTSAGLECLESWQEQLQVEADYLFIGDKTKYGLFIQELRGANLDPVFENSQAVIFKFEEQ